MEFSIPKIIHQTYKTVECPSHLNVYVEKFKSMNSGWKHILWTDADILTLVESRTFPEKWRQMFHQLPDKINRVDMMKYVWMYQHGGVYADIDVEPRVHMDVVVTRCFTGGHISIILAPPCDTGFRARELECAMMISKPFNPFWLFVLDEIYHRLHHTDVMTLAKRVFSHAWYVALITGPFMLGDVYRCHGDGRGIQVMPARTFYPMRIDVPWSKFQYDGDDDDVLAVHHLENSWIPSLDAFYVDMIHRYGYTSFVSMVVCTVMCMMMLLYCTLM